MKEMASRVNVCGVPHIGVSWSNSISQGIQFTHLGQLDMFAEQLLPYDVRAASACKAAAGSMAAQSGPRGVDANLPAIACQGMGIELAACYTYRLPSPEEVAALAGDLSRASSMVGREEG